MVVVAQLVRAPGCGPGGRRFKSGLPPHFFALISRQKNNEDASLHFTEPSGSTSHLHAAKPLFTKNVPTCLLRRSACEEVSYAAREVFSLSGVWMVFLFTALRLKVGCAALKIYFSAQNLPKFSAAGGHATSATALQKYRKISNRSLSRSYFNIGCRGNQLHLYLRKEVIKSVISQI